MLCRRCGNGIAEHELLGKSLAGFEHCRSLGGADYRDTVFLQYVDDSLGQGGLGADEDQIDSMFFTGGNNRGPVLRIDALEILSDLLCSGISRGNEQTGNTITF